jgi:hypothetical protein
VVQETLSVVYDILTAKEEKNTTEKLLKVLFTLKVEANLINGVCKCD